MVSDTISQQVRQDIIAYKQEHKLSDEALAKHVGVFQGQISKWRTGGSRPTAKSILRLVRAGVTSVTLPEQMRTQAIEKVLVRIDQTNKPKRQYKRRIEVPDIMRKEVASLLDSYVKGLSDKKSLVEHLECRDELINKLVYMCKQGG